MDGDFWADHDERCHGPIDTPENVAAFPEGFIWDCCDTRANDMYYHEGNKPEDEDFDEDKAELQGDGCELDRHKESSSNKRAKTSLFGR